MNELMMLALEELKSKVISSEALSEILTLQKKYIDNKLHGIDTYTKDIVKVFNTEKDNAISAIQNKINSFTPRDIMIGHYEGADKLSIPAATYDLYVINLTGNVSGITLSSMPALGTECNVILYAGDSERSVSIACNDIYKTWNGEDIIYNIPINGYMEVNFLYDGELIWVRAL